MSKERKITVLIELDHETNLKIINELARINQNVSKQSGAFVTKSKHLSSVIKEEYEQR